MKKIGFVVIIMVAVLINFNVCYAAEVDLSKLDSKGLELLNVIRKIGYWVIICMAIKDIIGKAMEQDVKSVGRIVFKYVIIYASFWFLPWALHFVEGIF